MVNRKVLWITLSTSWVRNNLHSDNLLTEQVDESNRGSTEASTANKNKVLQ